VGGVGDRGVEVGLGGLDRVMKVDELPARDGLGEALA
jgi:hypothetical protein